MKFFEWLRSGSSDEKSRYAFGFAGSITLIITVIWATSLPTRFAQVSDSMKSRIDTNSASIGESVSDIIQNAQDQALVPTDNTGTDGGINTNTPDPNVSALDQLTFNPDDASNTATETIQNTSTSTTTSITPFQNTATSSGVKDDSMSPKSEIILIATSSNQKTE